MPKVHRWALTLAALTLRAHTARSEEQMPCRRKVRTGSTPCTLCIPACGATAACSSQPSHAQEPTCVSYSLVEVGDDYNLGQWIAETIPEVIEPKSWDRAGASGVLRYYAPKKILVVYHTPEVQAKVAKFLDNMKHAVACGKEKCVPPGKMAAREPGVM